MKVGDYVRIKTLSGQGGIAKLKKVDDICITDNGAVDKNNIIKSSLNIIDLIEVGDYVNGKRVTSIDIEKRKIYVEEMYYFNKKDIKSIVTKEQFKNMEYKLED